MGPLPGGNNPSMAVSRKRVIKETPAQKSAGASKSTKTSGSDSITTGKKPTSSKPPTPSKRKVSPTNASDDEDRSPSRTRQAAKKRQKATVPLTKEKGSGTSKLASSSDKVSSEESPVKVTSIIPVVESHNSSPDNIPTKDDVGTTTSDLNTSNLNIDLDNLQGIPRRKSPALSTVLEDVHPIATIVPTVHTEESHSNDASPPTHQDKDMEENPQCSNSGNVVEQPTGSEDTISEHEAADEASNFPVPDKNETLTFGTTVSPMATLKQTSAVLTPIELEQLKNTDPVSFLKTMMNADNVSPIRLETSSNVLVEGDKKDDIPDLLHQIKEKFFETNLVEGLSKDPTSCFGLSNLLKKVDLLLVSEEVSQVIVSLSLLIEQLQAEILRKRNIDEQLKAKVTSHSSSWKAAGDATKKADALKLERSKRQKEYETCRPNIESWEQEIKRLEEQIKTVRSHQEEIKQSQQEELTEVAQLGIRHLETAQRLVPEIEELKKQQALIERRLSLWESQYSKMKDNLPRDFD
ncbi:uncharacterized protein LOC131637531 [Vicia villosa]|uniref:uncharacterized protein LOC131637531 n=1 Tax=Vicia villosa TaxID=3911 RepID=UPI00273C3154|nr:uncharacterized protein LOC131637531 [Vicia villosa]